jgi:predicted dehydrogenase/threonine dehydrogenase-like Zn-dependent dehydrogenase
MKQVLENLRNGDISVDEVPMPTPKPGYILVRNHYSLISAGTEGGTVKLGKMGYLGKAKARPEQVQKVIKVARTQGLLTAYKATDRSLDMPIVLGYSTAGTIIDAGIGINDLKVGDPVACAGSGLANHAEIVSIPRNLCTPIPENMDLRFAAFTTVGAIAMQGIRVANVKLGENVVVIGLGLVGILTAQILRAAGCNVLGIDINQEQLSFVNKLGYCKTANSNANNLIEQVMAFSTGQGADSVIITATTADNGPIALAGKVARHKARIVAVGRTEMKAPRETYLFKELELCTSYAYGPGTGDPSYEENGIDYPIGYVRWTENRNMSAFIDLISQQKINLNPLITHEFKIDDAKSAFDVVINSDQEHSIAVLLRYPFAEPFIQKSIIALQDNLSSVAVKDGKQVGVSIIGAGSHATNELIPLLSKMKNTNLRGIISATGVRAQALGKKYKFNYCTSEPKNIFNDDQSDCIYILTRHDSHAELTISALEAGKHVFVEKPLALSEHQLSLITDAQERSGKILLVGFNRRFAPMAIKMKNFFGSRAQPLFMNYRSNVGYRPPNHWLHNPQQGGGVVLGEACHFIDFCYWFVGKPVTNIDVYALNGRNTGLISEDNVHISLRFSDGSIATISYLSNGSIAYSREKIEVHCDNKTADLTDFKQLDLADGKNIRRSKNWVSADYGHKKQTETFIQAIIKNDATSIDTKGYLESSYTTLLVNQKLQAINDIEFNEI